MEATLDAVRSAPWRAWSGQAWAVALYELRRLRRGKHAAGRIILIGVPVIFAGIQFLVVSKLADHAFVDPLVLGGTQRHASAELLELARGFRYFDLPVVVFIATASLFGNLYHAEIADRTLHHVFLAPVRREIVTVGKYLAGVISVFVSVTIAWLLACGIVLGTHGLKAALATAFSADGLRHAWSYVAMLLLAVLAYGALFVLVGSLMKAPSLVAGAFFGWEWLTLFLPTPFKRLTILHWATSFMPASVTPEGLFATEGDPESRWVAVLVLLLFAGTCVTLATWRARRIQISYGASE